MLKNYRIEVKWGIIFTVVTLLWMVLERALGWHTDKIDQHASLTNIFLVPAILIYVLALIDKRKMLGGTMSWKQGFVTGLGIGLVVGILSPLSQLIVHKLISPDYFTNAAAYAESIGQPTEMFNLTAYIIMSTIFAVGAGAITGSIVALFVMKKA